MAIDFNGAKWEQLLPVWGLSIVPAKLWKDKYFSSI